jgi:hypothetical protein
VTQVRYDDDDDDDGSAADPLLEGGMPLPIRFRSGKRESYWETT